MVEKIFKHHAPTLHCCCPLGLRIVAFVSYASLPQDSATVTEFNSIVATIEDRHQVRVGFDLLVLSLSDSMHKDNA